MKVTGVSFVRNAEKFAYPALESIKSLLPICEEVVVAVGNSEDNTLELIKSIGDPKIRIIETIWDDNLREGGQVLAVETNKALDAVCKDTDWCFYLQADEVLHEKAIPILKKAMQEQLEHPEVEGFLFEYLHFWGSFDYVANSRKWYRNEIRIVRNDPAIRSYKDAQGFRKNGQKLAVKRVAANIFHYGWVRPPQKQQKKRLSSNRFWHSDEWIKENLADTPTYDYSNIDSVYRYKGNHPKIMEKRIASIDWTFSPPKNPKFSLKERISRLIEKGTGYRIGEYKNYKLLK